MDALTLNFKFSFRRGCVPTCRLPLGVQGVDVHGEVQLVADNLLVLAGEFIGAVDALGVPVSPVEAVLKHRDGKRMWQAYREREREAEISERLTDPRSVQ